MIHCITNLAIRYNNFIILSLAKHVAKNPIEPIYKRYKVQIDAIFQIMGNNYRKSAKIISWLYGGSDETWRKFLASNKPSKIPLEVKELFKKLKGS